MHINIANIRLSGFRGVPFEITYNLIKSNRPSNLVVYGGNARGKSTLADSIEFFISETGILERFEERESEINNIPGRRALINDIAQEEDFPTETQIKLLDDGTALSITDTRKITDEKNPVPACEASDLIRENLKTNPIIRGWELRSFVENWKAQGNYKEVAKWLGLEAFADLIELLRSKRLELDKLTKDNSGIYNKKKQIDKITNESWTKYEEQDFAHHINEKCLKPLNADFEFIAFSKSDSAYQKLLDATNKEGEILTKDRINNILKSITSLIGQEEYTDGEGNKHPAITGSIQQVVMAKKKVPSLKTTYNTKKSELANTYLSKAIEESKKALESEYSKELDSCFVCGTSFSDSKRGSKEKIIIQLSTDLIEFQELTKAEKALKEADNLLSSSVQTLARDLSSVISKLEDLEDEKTLEPLSNLKSKCENQNHIPEDENIKSVLDSLTNIEEKYTKKHKNTEEVEVSFAKAKSIFEDLLEEFLALQFEKRKMNELQKLSEDFSRLENQMNINIVKHTEEKIQELQDEVDDVYRDVLGAHVPKLKLTLPDNRKRNDKIHLRVDFSDYRKSVIPQGYLSDSQLHTLALCYHLVAIKRFNKCFPVAVLDDYHIL